MRRKINARFLIGGNATWTADPILSLLHSPRTQLFTTSQLFPKMLARLPKAVLANNRVAAAGAARQAGRTASVRIRTGDLATMTLTGQQVRFASTEAASSHAFSVRITSRSLTWILLLIYLLRMH